MEPKDVPKGDRIYPGARCDLCNAEIEIFDRDGDTVYLSCPNSEGEDGHDEYTSDVKTLTAWGWEVV